MTNNKNEKKKTTVEQMVDAIAKPEEKVKLSDAVLMYTMKVSFIRYSVTVIRTG